MKAFFFPRKDRPLPHQKRFPTDFSTRHIFNVNQNKKKVTGKPAKQKGTFQTAIKHFLTSELSEVVSVFALDSSYRNAYRRFPVRKVIRSECLFYLAVLFRKWRFLCARCLRSAGEKRWISLLLSLLLG